MSLIDKEIVEFTADAYHAGNGKFITVSSEDLKGHWSVVCFYPADFSFVCPTELEDLQEQLHTKLGMIIQMPSENLNTL